MFRPEGFDPAHTNLPSDLATIVGIASAVEARMSSSFSGGKHLAPWLSLPIPNARGGVLVGQEEQRLHVRVTDAIGFPQLTKSAINNKHFNRMKRTTKPLMLRV